jgi:FKBP-type peptidyl-prolyl cis-trans isomerase|tara:strand:- start:3261 stop:4016 length:756 start_codon:yes stop_codon:yes gene_type:complete
MKKIYNIQYLIALLFLFNCSSKDYQTSKNDNEPIVTYQDSLSYTMGINIGKNFPETDINQTLLIEGLKDFWENNEPRLNSSSRSEVLRKFNVANEEIRRESMRSVSDESKKISRENKIKGQEFLDKNKYNEGVKVFSRSKIQYKLITEGSGPLPDFDDTVIVHYNGYFIDGKKFDSSYDRGEPTTFAINQVIQGWQKTLLKMKVGSKWKVFIPEHLAYGVSGVPKDIMEGEYIIPPSSTLIFDIELIDIVE